MTHYKLVLGNVLLAAALWGQNAPAALQPPKGQALLLQLKGEGKQIYTCQSSGGAYAWKLKAPEAKLLRSTGELEGRHYAGPTWESNDGSKITGTLVASVPAPDATAIPWLLLSVKSQDHPGVLAGVQSIQRLDTKGGVAPTTGCAAVNLNAEIDVAYQANYYFYGGL